MLAVLRDVENAAAIMQPARLRMVELLREPSSATRVAKILKMPRQVVNYHLKALEKAGFVEFVEERRRGNCMERVVRATATQFLISPEALGTIGVPAADVRDRFSVAYLASAAGRIIRDLGILSVRARKAGKRLATFTLETEIRFRSPQDRNACAEEMANFMARLTSKYHDPEGRPFRLVTASYPLITKSQDDGLEAAEMS